MLTQINEGGDGRRDLAGVSPGVPDQLPSPYAYQLLRYHTAVEALCWALGSRNFHFLIKSAMYVCLADGP